MAFALPIVAVLALLILAPGVLFYYEVTPKIAVVGLTLPVLTLYGLPRFPHLFARREGCLFVGLAALQTLSVAAATILARNPSLSIGGSNWRRYGLVMHVAILLFALLSAAVLAEEPRRLLRWLQIFSSGGLLASLYLCLQYFGFDPLLPAEAYRIGEGEFAIVRPPGTLGHAGYAATFAVFSVFAGLALALYGSRGRILGWLTFATGSAAIVLSGTRGALLGLVVGGAVLVWFTRPRIRWYSLAAAAALVASSITFYVSPAGLALRSRVKWSTEDQLGGARLRLWRDSLHMGASRWVTGWGPEAFPSEFPGFQSAELARAYPDFYHESPHNIVVEAWTSQGLPGILILGGFCLLGLRGGRRSVLTGALAAGLASGIVSQMFLSFTAMTALCFYFFIAMLVAMGPPVYSPRPLNRASYALIPLTLVIAAYGFALLVSSRLLRVTEQQIAAGDLRDAGLTYESARAWQPPGVTSDLWFSRTLTEGARKSPFGMDSANAIPVAVAAAERATLAAEDPYNAFYNRAQLAALQSDGDGIEFNLRGAIRASPTWFKPHWALAEMLLLTGRVEAARAAARTAVDLDGGKHPEVRATLDKIEARLATTQP